MRRVEVRYEGRVQGVGFRYTAASLASRLPVTGYVQNLPDGAVRLVAEGARADLETLLREIGDSHAGGGIRRAPTSWSAATGEFRRFDIRHGA
jgi:acylphosphatase